MNVKSPPKVLLVEDDDDLAEMYQLQLSHHGYEVSLARNAQAAIDQLASQPADLILLDVLLAEQNGLSVLHELRSYSDWQQLPVIILSNVSAAELGISRATLERLRVFAYLEKAKTKPEALVAAVASALRKPTQNNAQL